MAFTDSYLLKVYSGLLDHYGDPHWWPGETPFEICIGAILTQNTAWTNVERSISRLKEEGILDCEAISSAPSSALAEAISSSGYYNRKAVYMKAFCGFLIERFDGDVGGMKRADPSVLRSELLSIRGIGEETADSILCYAAGAPVLVIDAYTRRLVRRLSPSSWRGRFRSKKPSYVDLQTLLTGLLKGDNLFYNRFHALAVVHCKESCRKEPLCEDCPVVTECDTGRKRI